MTTIRRPRLILATALLLAACGNDEQPAGVIPPEKFVAANVAVRSLPDDASARERAAVLRKHGVTEVQLKAWVNGHARDPETLAKAWEQIAFRLDSLSNPTVPPPPAPTTPDGQVPPPRPAEMADSVITRLPPPPPDRVGDPRMAPPRPGRKPAVQ
ncbi:hypothetical protein [Longimicrobium sp.]|uniref:hypothetical protein n=1 Tax=Longimicrobium sp. TaxID=2029185 RepID=UPI003B3BC3DA